MRADSVLTLAVYYAGNFQSRFIPNMIGAFLRVSLLPHIGLRRATIPIFFDMMEYEWKFKRNFHLVGSLNVFALFVGCLHALGQESHPACPVLINTTRWRQR